MVKLHGGVVPAAELTQADKSEMYGLMAAYYENTDRDTFLKDLGEKQWVVLLRDDDGGVRGFTTLMTLNLDCENKKITGVFSGDTIIDKNFWGSAELHRVWCRFALRLASEDRDTLCYWLLISKGYKTYRFLSTYFKEFYPRFDASTPEFEKKLMDRFGHCRYPGCYHSDRGVICFDTPKDHLKAGVADIDGRRLKDPHVAFFTGRNPGYGKGDELVCIARLSEDNLKPFVRHHFLGGA